MNHDERVIYMDAIKALDPVTAERLEPFAHRLEYGPDYDRGIRAAVGDVLHALRKGDVRGAQRWVLLAEFRAGVMDFETYEAEIATVLR